MSEMELYVRRKPHLLDANYYRLAYQLAAQQANRAAHEQLTKRHTEANAQDNVGRGLGSNADAAQTAASLLSEIKRVLGWFAWRQQHARFIWWRALKLPEQRLQIFLAATVEPCAQLIVAGAQNDRYDPFELPRGRKPRMTVTWHGLRRRSVESEIQWSYRAYYNLACSYAANLPELPDRMPHGPADSRAADDVLVDQRFAAALRALDQAFRGVHGYSRTNLWRRAQKDPSLAKLRASTSEFARLMQSYAPSGGPAKRWASPPRSKPTHE